MAQFASTLYPQTNPTNPILLEFRDASQFYNATERVVQIANYLHWIDNEFQLEWAEKHKSHARRVLTRLASLSG